MEEAIGELGLYETRWTPRRSPRSGARDTTATLRQVRDAEGRLEFAHMNPECQLPKGSITVNGIGLTVVDSADSPVASFLHGSTPTSTSNG